MSVLQTDQAAHPSHHGPIISSSSRSARLREPTAPFESPQREISDGSSGLGLTPPLVGRDIETDQVCALVDRAHDGGGALVVCGEAGIGKSALLDHARARANSVGAQTLLTVGVESEAELAFAGMHQLLRPIIGQAELLPSPQRGALEAAFGVRGDLEPDPFLVALAAHRLVCQAADARPVALIVDDAHLLDRSTLRVLSFIARRLEGESAVLIVAASDGCADPFREARLPSLRLERLDAEAAAE